MTESTKRLATVLTEALDKLGDAAAIISKEFPGSEKSSGHLVAMSIEYLVKAFNIVIEDEKARLKQQIAQEMEDTRNDRT